MRIFYETTSASKHWYCYSTTNGSLQDYAFTHTISLASGKSVTLKESNYVFDKSDGITKARAAIHYFRYSDGTKVYIPDSQLYWFSSDHGYEKRPIVLAEYKAPSQKILDKAAQYLLGINYVDIYTYVSKRFATSSYGGEWVASINPESHAEKMGLLVKDLIYGADDVLWNDDPFMSEVAKSRLLDGETVTFKVVRNGEEIEIPYRIE